jgi:hypothetical protein
MPEPQTDIGFAHAVRAVVATVLTLALPFVLYFGTSGSHDVLRVYLDALAAVVAFYFGASSKPG